MRIIHPRCCGLDVHKASVSACVLRPYTRKPDQAVQIKTFGTFQRDLTDLSRWLKQCGVTSVAMESTGVYWKPVWNVLEDKFQITLANPQQVKGLPGRKTDQIDCHWLGDLQQHGLIRASFVPPREVRNWRDVSRYRTRLVQQRTGIANRIQKILEDEIGRASCRERV